MSLFRWIEFNPLGDERGQLVALEEHRQIPFGIKRVYFLSQTRPDVSRGFHAHKDLEQVVVCVSGKCRMVLDDGKQREEAWLDSENKGLLISGMIWREMHDFSPDCVLLVLASEYYAEADYIRDYSDFVHQVNNG